MEISFLGTSAGAPSKSRNISATAIRLDNQRDWCLIDCGEATQHQLLHSHYSLDKLAAIAISHLHGDHCYGLPGLLASANLAGRRHPLSLIAPSGLEKPLLALLAATDLQLGFTLHFFDPGADTPLPTTAGFNITSIPLSHSLPSYAFQFCEAEPARHINPDALEAAGIPKGPLWGKIQRGEDIILANGQTVCAEGFCRVNPARRVIIAGDNDQPERLGSLPQADVWVHEATFTDDDIKKIKEKARRDPQHSSAAMVAKAAEKAGINQLILTHFSGRYHRNIEPIGNEAKRYFSGSLHLASDFDSYHLGLDKKLTLTRSR